MTTGPILGTVHALELGYRLRARRVELGLTVAVVGKETGLNGSNVSAYETATRKLTATSLRKLTDLYEVSPDEVAEFEDLRAEAERPQWWHRHEAVFGAVFTRFLGLEAGACSVSAYVPESIPGLLQTADYATAMIKSGSPYIRPVEVGERVEVRLARQTRLTTLDYRVVLGPAALAMCVGGRDVMRRQLDHLVGAVEQDSDRIRIRVWDPSQGAHPLVGSAVTLLGFDSRWVPDHAWLDTASAGDLTDRRSRVLELSASFDHVFERALSRDASLATIHRARGQLED